MSARLLLLLIVALAAPAAALEFMAQAGATILAPGGFEVSAAGLVPRAGGKHGQIGHVVTEAGTIQVVEYQ